MTDACKTRLAHPHTFSPAFTNLYSTQSNASFSDQNRLKTWLRRLHINRTDMVTMFVINCYLLMCIFGYVTPSICLMNGHELC